VTVGTSPHRGEPAPQDATDAAFRDQLAMVADALTDGDLRSFYQVFRSTDLPFLAMAHEAQARPLFRLCFEILHRFGAISPATALAIENHYYVTCALATVPWPDGRPLDARRELLSAIAERRVLVANTNSKVHTGKLGTIGTCAERDGGRFHVNGTAAYMSLATEADMLVFITQLADEGPAIFVIEPLQSNPSIEIGPYLFPAAMLDSDTHRVTFHDLDLPADALLVGPNDKHASAFIAFEMAWHQLLIPALYLGAAAGAIEEVRCFVRATRGKDNQLLVDVDGVVVDVGRLAIEYRSAIATVLQAGDRLAEVRHFPDDLDVLESAVDAAGVAKYVGTRCAEAVVAAARRIIGPRLFTGGHLLERLSQEVMFGPLGPEVNSVIEHRHGRRALRDSPFVERWW
jgi:alkylation response protein AidB-like acyl-CoA dehydrogenase